MRSELHPVIHYRDRDTTLRNAEIAAEAGCAGIFLIHMDGEDYLLDSAAGVVRSHFPGLAIGINRLSLSPVAALRQNLALGVDSTWSDRCGVTSRGHDALADSIREALCAGPDHDFFGSVAFKYQQPEIDPPKAARIAASLGFIPTTSGAATGSAPSVEKIAGMAQALGSKALAVASGITPENAAAFVPHVRYFLVSTGISRSFYEFDPARVVALNRLLASDGGAS